MSEIGIYMEWTRHRHILSDERDKVKRMPEAQSLERITEKTSQSGHRLRRLSNGELRRAIGLRARASDYRLLFETFY
jgi:hypothetical protein